MTIKAGVILPGGSASTQLDQAILAEQSGWDGVFVWEGGYGVDAWGLLAAMAASTTRVKLGTVLTPLPWRRPPKLASQVATLDELSGGRAILTVGVGDIATGMPMTSEDLDIRKRADMMDEGIDVIRSLWAGQQEFHGRHYSYACSHAGLFEALRQPRPDIPIWVVGAWPRPRSMRRVLKCDGVLPQYVDGAGPEALAEVKAWLDERTSRPIDVISEGETPGDDASAAAEVVRPWAEAGASWWLETRWEMPHNSDERMAEISGRIAAGPPVP
ncbi:LLM class flavin-dependent oxidoreductase [Kribbella sp. NPDC026611]|uniref:LLM class flavin-dependent oxidoreductase n=1 Tax=Kribbella sp. NPDC026611 TaxID=3154911 RepID=UPI0033F41709